MAASSRTPSARALAADLVNAVILHRRSLTAALDGVRAAHEPRLLATAQDLSYGVMRHYGRLHYLLRRLTGRPPDPPEMTGHLLVALFELSDRDTPSYAVVNEAVEQAGRRQPRARGFVNAVLRNFLRRRDQLERAAEADPEAHWNFPVWWINRLREQHPSDWKAILTAMIGHPPMTLRVNRRRIDMPGYQARLDAAGMPWRATGEWALTLETPVRVGELPGFAEGLVSVQDLGAQLAAPLLDCADGMRVLDACAAPGGKTAHLLESHDLELTALDADAGRLGRVADYLARLGLKANLLAADAGQPDSCAPGSSLRGDPPPEGAKSSLGRPGGRLEGWWDGRPYQRILLDAPCTASGVARRHPDGKWLKRCEDVTALAIQQARLLDAVWPLLEQGGKLLYATCSLFREENGDQIDAFLSRHADARRIPLLLPGATAGQLLPDRDRDGFFYACILKA